MARSVAIAQYDPATGVVQSTASLSPAMARRMENVVEITDHPDRAMIFEDPRGWVVENGAIRPAAGADEEFRSILRSRLDALTESVAERYVGSGARLTRARDAKLSEARSVALRGDPGAIIASDFPYLANEVGITGQDVPAVAAAVIAKHEAWLAVDLAIERIRQEFQATVAAAATRVEASSAYEQAALALNAIPMP